MNQEFKSPYLGMCCCCGVEGPQVRTMIMLNKKSPIPGHGWGCVVCHLPNDGASYVCCDACFEARREPYLATRGYPGSEGRISINELTGEHEHNYRFHIRWFTDSPDVGQPDCLCSLCGEVIDDEDETPLRIFNRKHSQEARFHDGCAKEIGSLACGIPESVCLSGSSFS